MVFRQFYIDDDLQIGIWKIQESEEELIRTLGQSPPTHLGDNAKRRREWLSVRCLAKAMNDGGAVDIAHEGRRPFLKNGGNISISHSGDWVAVAMGRREVGIDIECQTEKARNVASRFMNDEEYERWSKMAEDSRRYFATVIWCAKEAVFKTYKDGCVDFKHDIATEAFEEEAMGNLKATDRKGETVRHYDVKYMLHSMFVLTISTPVS